MPIKIPDLLPAKEILQSENIFVMDEDRAVHQDIRPLKIAILNLMPTKIATETQLLRLLGNTPFQVEVTLVRTSSYQSKNTPEEHLLTFYQTFDQIKDQKFDALIITGAPVEHLAFEQVDYWEELKQIMDWGLEQRVFPAVHLLGRPGGPVPPVRHPQVSAAGQAVRRVPAPACWRKTSSCCAASTTFSMRPHSRHTEIRRADIEKVPELEILAESDEAGVYIVATRDGRQIFVTGHSEYDPLTLKKEYDRDVAAGLPIAVPVNYYPGR